MTRKTESVRLRWGIVSHELDWRSAGFVERWIGGVVSAGIVARIEKLALGYDRTPVDVPKHAAADVPRLLAERTSSPGEVYLLASGTEPYAWELSLSILPSAPNDFISNAVLEISGAPDEGLEFSNRLWTVFRSTHTAADTLRAYIHPSRRFFADRMRRPPILSRATFDSVWWANFWSPSQLRFFRRQDLDPLDAETVAWTPDGSLFLRLAKSIGDVDRKGTRTEVERRRRFLVERFVSALVRHDQARPGRDR
jgi:hypothetical protein